MECIGRVLKTTGDTATVLIETSGCDRCHACGITAIQEEKQLEVRALNRLGAGEGDSVRLEMSGRKVMAASAVLFLIPFLGFVAGLLIGYYGMGALVGDHYRMLAALLLAFGLLALSYIPVARYGKKETDFEFVIKSFATGPDAKQPF